MPERAASRPRGRAMGHPSGSRLPALFVARDCSTVAGPAVSAARPVVGVGLVVRMSPGTVRLAGMVVPAVADDVQVVLTASAVGEVAGTVVQLIAVKVPGLQAQRPRTDERGGN